MTALSRRLFEKREFGFSPIDHIRCDLEQAADPTGFDHRSLDRGMFMLV